ncbi:MAG TPA: hypothetical protein QF761_13620, partial [Pirellulales bacterium]|nr:hypothetical protein [Pirellulales bacterium]
RQYPGVVSSPRPVVRRLGLAAITARGIFRILDSELFSEPRTQAPLRRLLRGKSVRPKRAENIAAEIVGLLLGKQPSSGMTLTLL